MRISSVHTQNFRARLEPAFEYRCPVEYRRKIAQKIKTPDHDWVFFSYNCFDKDKNCYFAQPPKDIDPNELPNSGCIFKLIYINILRGFQASEYIRDTKGQLYISKSLEQDTFEKLAKSETLHDDVVRAEERLADKVRNKYL